MHTIFIGRIIAGLILTFLIPSMAFSGQYKPVSKTELYKQLYGINSTKDCKKNTDCRMLRRHLIRDNKNCQMSPRDVQLADQQINQTFENKLKIDGRMKFLGLYPAPYKYYFYNAQGTGAVLRARIFISNAKDFSQSEIKKLRSKLSSAAKIWTNGNTYKFKMNFDFDITTSSSEATVSVKLLRGSTRGPYFSKWSLNWSSTTIAHEMGHVMGLDDEYSNHPFGSSVKCKRSSLMCSSYSGRPLKYHYYLIFRRALCYQ
jgi:predicted Zn-dependent protease